MSGPSPVPTKPAAGQGRRRPSRRLAVSVVSLAIALLLAACGDDDGLRVVAPVTETPATPSPTAQPDATPMPVPERPSEPLNGGGLVAEYLQFGEADRDGCLPELVEAWEMAAVDRPRCVTADLDGDGSEEYIFLATFAEEGADDTRADAWFFKDTEGEQRLYHSATALTGGLVFNARIVDVVDVTADGVDDVLIGWERCRDELCTTRLIVASHHNGSLENLAPLGVGVEALQEIEVDADEQRITLHGGTTEEADAASGPRRGTTTELWWSTARFRAAERPSDAEYLVHLLNDADDAYHQGNYRDARRTYQEVAADSELRDWRAELGEQAARPELQAYALFRAALSAQRSGDGTAMLELLDRAADEHPDTMHGAAAHEYREALGAGQSPAAACEAVEAYVSAFASFYRDFWDYGSANPERSLVTLCR